MKLETKFDFNQTVWHEYNEYFIDEHKPYPVKINVVEICGDLDDYKVEYSEDGYVYYEADDLYETEEDCWDAMRKKECKYDK